MNHQAIELGVPDVSLPEDHIPAGGIKESPLQDRFAPSAGRVPDRQVLNFERGQPRESNAFLIGPDRRGIEG
jgi:hypothetical protein